MRTLFALLSLSLAAAVLGAAELPYSISWRVVPEVAGATFCPEAASSALLPDGRLLICLEHGEDHTCRIFDPETDTWSTPVDAPTCWVLLIPLADGTVAAQAVYGLAMYLFDPVDSAFRRIADRPVRDSHSVEPTGMYLLPRGSEIIAAGSVDGIFQTHVYDAFSDSWPQDDRAPDGWNDGLYSTVTVSSIYRSYLRSDGKLFLPYYTSFGDGQAWVPRLVDAQNWTVREYSVYKTSEFRNVSSPRLADGWCMGTCYLEDGARSPVRFDSATGVREVLPSLPSQVSSDNWNTFPAALVFEASGRDHIAYVRSIGNSYSAIQDFPAVAYNWADGTWDTIPGFSIAPQSGTMWVSHPLRDGALCTIRLESGGLLFRRMVVTGNAPVPPGLVLSRTTVTLREGSLATFDYWLTGTIPPEGMKVVAERVVSGTGRVSVVDNAVATIYGRDQKATVTLAAGLDADGEDDSAVIRVRMVPPTGSGIDPDAQTITVNVEDTIVDDDSPLGTLPGDVNDDGVVNALDLDDVIDHFGTQAE